MTPTILAAALNLNVAFAVGGVSQTLSYAITVNPVTAPQDSQHVLSLILKIVSPSGFVMYKNTGWDTSNFGSPDSLTGTETLPPVTGTSTPESGVYVVNIQAKYVDSTSTPVTTLATRIFSTESLCIDCLPVVSLLPTTNCSVPSLIVQDTTNYSLSGYTTGAIVRNYSATPPSGSGQPDATSSTEILAIDNQNANGVLWNGLYVVGFSGSAIYTRGNTTITQTTATSQNVSVGCADTICILQCTIEDLSARYQSAVLSNPPTAPAIFMQLTYAGAMMAAAMNAVNCGDDYQEYIDTFYEVTKIDYKCESCGGSAPTGPVQPIGAPQRGPAGTNGTNGTQWRHGTTVPSNTLGADGDYYIDTTTSNYYLRVSGVYVLQGAFTGTNGTNGSSLLWPPNVLPQYTWDGASGSTGNSYVSNTIPANKLSVNGDSIEFTINTLTPAKNHGFIEMAIGNVGGSPTAINIPIQGGVSANTAYCVSKVYVQYIGSNLIQVDVKQQYFVPSSTIAVGWQQEYEFNYDTSSAFQYAYNPTVDGVFVLYFSNATAACGVSFIEAVLKKI